MQPFPTTGAKYQVSTDGDSHHPAWSPDGRELFYVPGPARFASRSITTTPSVAIGNPVRIPIQLQLFLQAPSIVRTFDIMLDGRILGVTRDNASQPDTTTLTPPQLHVVLNWFEELKARVPSGNRK
jgi:hypothetical protein